MSHDRLNAVRADWMVHTRTLAAAAALLTATACASLPAVQAGRCADASRILTQSLSSLDAAGAMPGGCEHGALAATCQEARERIERLATTCPAHAPTLVASALIAYEERNFTRAEIYLDAVFSLRSVPPEAAALRARLALDEGNLPLALRVTEEHLIVWPDHAGLREVRAAALFVGRRFAEASAELDLAGRLGAPEWRVAYDRGLIEEAEGRPGDAEAQYEAALRGRPGWPPASARLRALRAAGNRAPRQGP